MLREAVYGVQPASIAQPPISAAEENGVAPSVRSKPAQMRHLDTAFFLRVGRRPSSKNYALLLLLDITRAAADWLPGWQRSLTLAYRETFA